MTARTCTGRLRPARSGGSSGRHPGGRVTSPKLWHLSGCIPSAYTRGVWFRHERSAHPARPARARAQPRLRPQARLRHATSAGASRCRSARSTRRWPGWPGTARWSSATAEPGAGPDRKRYVITERGRDRGRDLARRAGRARAAPADRAVRQGRAGADAGPAGRASTSTPSAAAHLQRMRELTELKRDRRPGRRAAGRPRPVPPRGRSALDRPDRGPARRAGQGGAA